MLFSGPKVLLDLPESQLEELQQEEINVALAEHRIEMGDVKALEADHVESLDK